MSYAAGALLELPDGRIAMHHRDNKPYIASPNKWAFFGGMGEAGEQPIDTVIRELKEELEVNLIRERLTLIHNKSHKPNHTLYIFHYPVTDELDNAVLHEGQDWGKLTSNEINKLDLVAEHRRIIVDSWKQKTYSAIYLVETDDHHILLPPDGLNWHQLIKQPSESRIFIPSATRYQVNTHYKYQFTHHNHPQLVTEIYTSSITNSQFLTVNLDKWVKISSETVDKLNLDFHTQAIIERYWQTLLGK